MLNIMYPPADWSTLKKLIWLRGTPINGGEEVQLNLTAFASPTEVTTTKKPRVTSCKVNFTPSQDLHGYSNPWPAGGGVNQLPTASADTTTYAGITFSTDGNGKYTIKGTSTSEAFAKYSLDEFNIPSGNTHVFAIVNNQANSNVSCSYLYNDDAIRSNSFAFSSVNRVVNYSALSNEPCNGIMLKVASGETVDITCYPMLAVNTVVGDTYIPYANLCPITGWTGAEATRSDTSGGTPTSTARVEFPVVSANQWDEEWEIGIFNPTTGDNIDYITDQIRAKNLIPVKPSETYYFYKGGSGGTWMMFFDKDRNVISDGLPAGSGQSSNVRSVANMSITMPSNCHYVRFYNSATYGATYGNNISINYPSTVTTYNPYSRTIYGGWVDTETGDGEIEWKAKDMGDLVWQYDSQYSRFISDSLLSDMKRAEYVRDQIIYCSIFQCIHDRRPLSSVPDMSIYTGIDKYVYVHDSDYSDASAFTSVITGQTLVYPLATHIPFHCDPATLTLLKGTNYVWAEMEAEA